MTSVSFCVLTSRILISIHKNCQKYRDYAGNTLKKIRGHGGGIFIFFNLDEKEQKVLLVGYSEDLYPEQGADESAIKVSPYIINQNPTIKKHFANYLKGHSDIPQATDDEKKQAFVDYIHKYSILFICLRPSSNASLATFKPALIKVVKGLNALLHPQIKED